MVSVEIELEEIGPWRYQVRIVDSRTTVHRIQISPAHYDKLTGKQVDPERLLMESIHYLLEHEPNTSILEEFDLRIIERYFPRYEEEIRRRLGLETGQG